jgi:predicted RNA binding protein YcfA (HicA-like mRNA interferase family)
MSRIVALHYRKIARAFERAGFVLDRHEGDHLIYVRPGIKRPVVIPMYHEVPVLSSSTTSSLPE